MNKLSMLALAVVTGIALGAVFFGGLWWTVRKGVTAKLPGLWFLASLLLRVGIVIFGFFIIGRGDWSRWAACLAGFIIAKFIVIRLTRASAEENIFSSKEESRAP